MLGSATTAIGVWGASQSNVGVIGSSASSHGMVGTAAAASTSGVFGTHTSPGGVGVSGQSGPGTGVQATSTSGVGLIAVSSTNTAIVGRSATGKAAEFFGDVQINGNFIATGQKSAAVRVADGSVRRVYCLEAPQSYFEDVGRGEITDSYGAVTLDPMFASTVATDDYHVFLTPEGDCQGLCVEARTPDGFVVRELRGGASSIPFSFRVVAKRTGITNERFAPVELSAGPGAPDSGPQPTQQLEVEMPVLPTAS